MPNTALRRAPGPLERTAIELEHLRRAAAFRRGREMAADRRLRESDALLDLVEQCRLKDLPLVPTQLWVRIVRFVGAVDAGLRDELGINRHPDHAGDVLFSAQHVLLRHRVEERQPRMATIIQLFGGEADDQLAAVP